MTSQKAKARRVDFSPDEFLVGVTGMTSEQIGVYWVVCSLIYSSGGPVSVDDSRIIKCGGTSTRRWPGLRRELVDAGKLFIVDGKLHNRRSMLELEKVIERVAEARANGRTGGRPRKPAAPDADPEQAEKGAFSGSSAEVPKELGDSSAKVHDELGEDVSSEISNLAKPNGFPAEKLTTNYQLPTTSNPPLSPPEGGGPTEDGGQNGRDLLGGQPAEKTRRSRGDGANRGTRVPDGDLPDGWAEAANQTREKHALPLLTGRVLNLRWESFRNYWLGVPGGKGLRRDWRATWLNDCINGVTERRFPPDQAKKPPSGPMFDTMG